ncbi:hypothetical protein QUB13_24680 [Microcoleus sp. B4-D4]
MRSATGIAIKGLDAVFLQKNPVSHHWCVSPIYACTLCDRSKKIVRKQNIIAIAAVKNKKTRLFPPKAEAKDDSS